MDPHPQMLRKGDVAAMEEIVREVSKTLDEK